MPQEPFDPRLDTPIVRESIRKWFLSLAESPGEVPEQIEALGIVLILLARRLPRTAAALTGEDTSAFRRRLERWRKALSELLSADLNGGR